MRKRVTDSLAGIDTGAGMGGFLSAIELPGAIEITSACITSPARLSGRVSSAAPREAPA